MRTDPSRSNDRRARAEHHATRAARARQPTTRSAGGGAARHPHRPAGDIEQHRRETRRRRRRRGRRHRRRARRRRRCGRRGGRGRTRRSWRRLSSRRARARRVRLLRVRLLRRVRLRRLAPRAVALCLARCLLVLSASARSRGRVVFRVELGEAGGVGTTVTRSGCAAIYRMSTPRPLQITSASSPAVALSATLDSSARPPRAASSSSYFARRTLAGVLTAAYRGRKHVCLCFCPEECGPARGGATGGVVCEEGGGRVSVARTGRTAACGSRAGSHRAVSVGERAPSGWRRGRRVGSERARATHGAAGQDRAAPRDEPPRARTRESRKR